MSKKSKVLKAFLILAAAIAICMYFSRTIQTITTPKVKLVTADVGRIEQKVAVALSPYFPVKTEITLTKAKDYPITVDKVYVKTGLYVEKGDTILTAVINDYDKEEKELTDSYAKKAQEDRTGHHQPQKQQAEYAERSVRRYDRQAGRAVRSGKQGSSGRR